MSDLKVDALFNALAERWLAAMGERRFEDAVCLGLAGYLICRELGESDWARESLTWASDAATGLSGADPFTRKRDAMACSFCGRKQPEVRLAGGPTEVYICEPCVELLGKTFAEMDKK